MIVVGMGAGRGVSGFEGRGVCDGSVGEAKDGGWGVGDGSGGHYPSVLGFFLHFLGLVNILT